MSIAQHVRSMVAPIKLLLTALIVELLLTAQLANGAIVYTIIDLGYLPGFTYAEARGINNFNVVVGTLRSPGSGVSTRGFRWTPTTGMEDLGPASYIGQINDSGVAAGTKIDGTPALWRVTGEVSPLAMPIDSTLTDASGISNAGYVSGRAQWPNTPRESQGCVWAPDGEVTLLSRLSPDRATTTNNVNDSGVSVGAAVGDGGGLLQPVAWSRSGELVQLETPASGDDAKGGAACVVSKAGLIFGYTWVTSTDTIATAWHPDGRISALIPPPSGYSSSVILGVNELGQKIGLIGGLSSSGEYVQASVIWQSSGELTILPPLVGATYTQAHAINELGWIAGVAQDAAGNYHGVVWQPVPEPSTLASLIIGLGVGVWHLSRRNRA